MEILEVDTKTKRLVLVEGFQFNKVDLKPFSKESTFDHQVLGLIEKAILYIDSSEKDPRERYYLLFSEEDEQIIRKVSDLIFSREYKNTILQFLTVILKQKSLENLIVGTVPSDKNLDKVVGEGSLSIAISF
ncbi:hypothetical protein ACFLY7_00220 [Patescibacteria group bacterium]